MKFLVNFLTDHWLLLAICVSMFWGIRSTFLFTTSSTLRLSPDQRELYFFRYRYPRIGSFLIGIYKFIFNFVGSFAGWCCFYVLLSRIKATSLSVQDFTSGDAVLFIVSLLGLTGHLPQVTYGLIQAVESLVEKAIGKMTG